MSGGSRSLSKFTHRMRTASAVTTSLPVERCRLVSSLVCQARCIFVVIPSDLWRATPCIRTVTVTPKNTYEFGRTLVNWLTWSGLGYLWATYMEYRPRGTRNWHVLRWFSYDRSTMWLRYGSWRNGVSRKGDINRTKRHNKTQQNWKKTENTYMFVTCVDYLRV